MASPVKSTLNGSIPIGLTDVTKLCLSSVSFRSSTSVYKSDIIGSTGERNTVLTCQSTGVSSNQPASSICISSVQPAFRWISAGVSGKLNRRNQPAFKPYASDRPALRIIVGPPVIYVSCPRTSSSLFRPTPAAADLVLAPPLASAPPPLAAARLHVEPPPPRPRARPAPPVRACAARANALRRRLRA